MPELSVIVPVYKVEKYLSRCIDSILNQTYTDFELILIDDGSPDNCGKICDEYAEKDQRIKVIHKENGGLSDARNVGMSMTCGKYICFIDSDDWVHPDFLYLLYNTTQTHSADIVACGFLPTSIYQVNEIEQSPKVSIYTAEEALATLIDGTKFCAVVWNKIYRRELLENEKFEVGRLREDEFFTYRILSKTNRLAYIDLKLYFYFQHTESIMNSFSPKHLDFLDAYSSRMLFFKHNFPELYTQDKIPFCIACMNGYILASTLPRKDRNQCFKKIKNIRNTISFDIKEFRYASKKHIVYIIGTKFFPLFTSKIINRLRGKFNENN